MSIARTTIGISRAFETLATASAGRRGLLTALLCLCAGLILVAGLYLALGGPQLPVIIIGATLASIAIFVIMLVRHEWLLLLAIVAGHSIFYGKFPNALGMRIKDALGPGDLLLFVAFIASLIYWGSQRERPKVSKALIVAPLLLFLYTVGYLLIAFFEWGRQDFALKQVIGWLYFAVALPTYLCLTTGRIWNAFFVTLFLTLLAGAFLAFFVQLGIFDNVINLFGYGGLGARSFGDLTVRTNQLGFAIPGVLISIVVAGFATRPAWKYASLASGLSAATIIFLDRGRATYAGIVLAVLVVLAFMPMAPRLRFIVRAVTTITVGVLLVLLAGGKVSSKFMETVEKAQHSVELTSRQAILADTGIEYRAARLRQADAIFRKYPWFGGGPGTYFKMEYSWVEHEYQPTAFIDNSWIYPLAVGGIVGMSLLLLCYGSFIGVTIFAILKLKHPFHRALAAVPLGQMAWLLVCSPVNWWLIDQFHIAAFSFGVAMVAALVYHERVHGSDVPVINIGS